MRKLFILLLLGFLVACSPEKNAGNINRDQVGEGQVQTYKIEKERIPKDYAYVQDKDVFLVDELGSPIRKLNFQERVFIFRKRADKTLVVDNYGNRGWVDQEFLSKRFTSYIDLPLEGVDYSLYTVKDKPYKDYVKTKGIYVMPYNAEFIYELLDRIKGSAINTLVMDFHDDYGRVLFESKTAEELAPDALMPLFEDGPGFIRELKDQGYHLIARIVAFKDPIFAELNKERAIRHADGSLLVSDGQYWNSPYDRQVWDYLLALTNEAIEMGFDEIQFDYVRFPDNFEDDMLALNERNETKAEAIQKFLMYIKANINDKNTLISADVFGWAAIEQADVTIGQQWEALSNVVDVISPMFYPALYGPGVFGMADPEANPYEVLKISINYALERNSNVKTAALIRPWLQSWNYSIKEIKEQIRALEEAGIEEYLLWQVDGNYPVEGLD